MSGRFYLKSDYAVQCWVDTDHILATCFAIFFLIIYVLGIPIGAAVILYRKRHVLDDPKVKKSFGALYKSYHPDHWYFESVEMTKKMLLAGGLILLGVGSSAQILIGFFITFFFLLVVVGSKPYEDSPTNKLQTLSSIQLVLSLVIGLVLRLESGDNDSVDSSAVEFVLIGTTGIVFAITVYIFLNTLSELEAAKTLKIVLEKLNKCVKYLSNCLFCKCVPMKNKKQSVTIFPVEKNNAEMIARKDLKPIVPLQDDFSIPTQNERKQKKKVLQPPPPPPNPPPERTKGNNSV